MSSELTCASPCTESEGLSPIATATKCQADKVGTRPRTIRRIVVSAPRDSKGSVRRCYLQPRPAWNTGTMVCREARGARALNLHSDHQMTALGRAWRLT